MIITDSNTTAKPKLHKMDLVIEQDGLLGIVVKSGALTLNGADETLDDDDAFTVTDRPEAADIMAYVVKDTHDSDAIAILVDEVVLDGVDMAYAYKRGDQYELIATLYSIHIPGDTSDLANVALKRYTIKEA